MANKRNLLLLMDRPLEPVFLEKGKNNVKFDVPSNLLSDRYKGRPDVTVIQDRFGDTPSERIAVTANVSIPNLSIAMSLGRDEPFSLFIPRHKTIAANLIDIFLGM